MTLLCYNYKLFIVKIKNMNFDPEVHYHKADYNDSDKEDLYDALDALQDAIALLDKWSVYHDDEFSPEVADLEDLLHRCNQKL